jgi:hypothetical protein
VNSFNGFDVICDFNLTEAGEPIQIKRLWRERLFTLPWQPFRATKWVTTQIPMKKILKIHNKLYMHPTVFETLKNLS